MGFMLAGIIARNENLGKRRSGRRFWSSVRGLAAACRVQSISRQQRRAWRVWRA